MISFLMEDHESIRKFFSGDDAYIPISEYKYLHDRPLIRPTFLTQIDDLAKEVALKMVKSNTKAEAQVTKLKALAITVGQNLDGELTNDKVTNILKALRDIYKICTDLNKKLK